MSAGAAAPAAGERRASSPIRWAILAFPYGVPQGFAFVPLTFLATRNGLSITEGAGIAGAYQLALWLRFLWAPLVDVTLSAKRWFALSSVGMAGSMIAMSAVPPEPRTFVLLLAVVFAAGFFATLNSAACNALIALATPAARRGQSAGWSQAGNIVGGAVGGASLALMGSFSAPWMLGAALGLCTLASCLALAGLPDLRTREGDVLGTLRQVARDMSAMLRRRSALLSMLMLLLPINTGAALTTLSQSAVAARWGADEGHVALVQGLLAGVVAAVGCLVGGGLADRMARRAAYCVVAVVYAGLAAAMSVSPATPAGYVWFCLAYQFMYGAVCGVWVALVFDTIGAGAPGTKLSVLFAIGWFPAWWVGLLEGRVADLYGAPAMLLLETGLGLGSLVVIFACARMLRERITAPAG